MNLLKKIGNIFSSKKENKTTLSQKPSAILMRRYRATAKGKAVTKKASDKWRKRKALEKKLNNNNQR